MKPFRKGGTLWPVMVNEVIRSMKNTNFNRTHTANELGISLRTLRLWLMNDEFNDLMKEDTNPRVTPERVEARIKQALRAKPKRKKRKTKHAA